MSHFRRPYSKTEEEVAAQFQSLRAPEHPALLPNDPDNRLRALDPDFGIMSVPMVLTRHTKGRDEWIRSQGEMKKDLSLCCLFQRGRCNLGAKCHQIHVDRDYVNQQRKVSATAITCCAHCGDEVSRSDAVKRALARAFPDNTVLVSLQDDTVERVPVERLGWTHRLQSLVEGHSGATPLALQWSRVCRLHQQGRCKYGSYCKNVHMCRTHFCTSAVTPATPTPAVAATCNTTPLKKTLSATAAPFVAAAHTCLPTADDSESTPACQMVQPIVVVDPPSDEKPRKSIELEEPSAGTLAPPVFTRTDSFDYSADLCMDDMCFRVPSSFVVLPESHALYDPTETMPRTLSDVMGDAR